MCVCEFINCAWLLEGPWQKHLSNPPPPPTLCGMGPTFGLILKLKLQHTYLSYTSEDLVTLKYI